MVLKPLARALGDGDRVDAVILASGANQDGRSNGITAPSALAQAQLLRSVLRKAGVSADSVDLIETHGTGTRLGDPIEAAALREVYGERPLDAPLRVSALKGCTGHASEAAGIGGLIAAIQALRHGVFPPIAGFAKLNAHLAEGPAGDGRLLFSAGAAPWPQPAGRPRRAAVSSFGLSGTNVQVIVQEAAAVTAAGADPGALPAGAGEGEPNAIASSLPFLLSAAAPQDLARRRADLADWLAAHPDAAPAEVAATLLFHREPMACRWGACAASLEELRRKLAQDDGDAGHPLVMRWLAGETPQADWLPCARKPPLALPAYPFRGPRLWGGRTLPEAESAASLLGEAQPDGGFLRVFRGDEALAADHQVGGQALLHAAVMLEMALEAAQPAALAQLAWLKPLEIGAATPVATAIADDELTISRDGVAHFSARLSRDEPAALEPLPAETLWQSLPAAEDGGEAAPAGVYLGPSFPGPDRIRSDGVQALAFLENAPAQGLAVAPALLDAAIRTAAAAVAGAEAGGPVLRFPARLERLQRLAELPPQGYWLHARRRRPGAARAVETVDVVIHGRTGEPLLRMDGLVLASAQPAENLSATAPGERDAAAESPVAASWRVAWRELPAVAHGHAADAMLVVAAEAGDALADALCRQFPEARRLAFDADFPAALSGLPRRAAVWFLDGGGDNTPALLRLLQALAKLNLDVTLRIVARGALAVLPGETPPQPHGAAALGLGKAAGREFPEWRVRLFDLEPARPADAALVEQLLGDPGDELGEAVALRGGRRYAQRLEPLGGAGDAAPVELPAGAHVIFVGGAGRLGREVSKHLARSRGARVSVIGRAPLDPPRQALLDEIRRLGGQAGYHAADIADRAALNAALDAALAEFGPAALLIQAAVDPAFARIERAVPAEFAAALAPKVAGLVNLADALAQRDIAALAVFSSIGAFAGFPANDGQASYCAACTFEASHALGLAQRLGKPVRVIHWGLWDSGDFPPEALAQMGAAGLYAMSPDAIGESLYDLLRQPFARTVHARLAASAWLDVGVAPAALERHAAPLAEAARRAMETGSVAEGEEAGSREAAARLSARIDAGLAAVLSSRGLAPGASVGAEDALRKLALLPRHRRLADALLHMALRRGLLRRENGEIHRVSPAAPNTPNTGGAPVDAGDDAGLGAALRLLDRCLAALPQVLAGELPATEVLFPQGSMDWVEPIYRDQPVLADCGRRLAAAVAAAVAAGARRVLEIGAGTGSTAGPVLDALREAGLEGRCHYLYTDVSRAFVRHGQTRFGNRLGGARVLDIARPPGEQGMDTGVWDVIVASNVLHATPDMRATLGHVAELLAPGGIVLVNEMVEPDHFATLTFGLLDGWWEAEDPECRLQDGPILSIAGWRDILRRAGLRGRWAYDSGGRPESSVGGQAILLAYQSAAPADSRRTAPARHSGAAPANEAGAPAAAPPASRAALETALRDILAAVLDTPAATLERDRPFMEMGVDSLIAPQIAEEVLAALGCPLRVTDIYKHGNLAALAAHLLEAYPEQAGRVGRASAASAAVPQAPARRHPADDAPQDRWPSARQGEASPDAIAIIGMAARYAGAPDLDALWRLLDEGRHAIAPVDRFDLEPWFDPAGGPGKTYARWGGFLEDYDRFDPYFFNITPAEAEVMDPQQRVLMEEAWKALESAGLSPETVSGGRCGLFIGASANNYQSEGAPGLRTLGSSMAILSARMAYVLNLRGPTFPIDTGCSSSLVAVHQACQSLRSGECDLALAGGVSVNLISPDIFLYLADAGMASHSGASRTFDDNADGFVPGEGAGVVVLKRLADALADGDRIDAVIAGSGINQDGRTAGLTAPSSEAQAALLLDVYRRYGLDPSEFGMVEAHGTGTRLGDPIEVQALTEAFRHYTGRNGGCALGSVKTNIGHSMAAAGMAGIAKALLALRHRRIPASLNFAEPNRHIDFADSPFFVPTRSIPWPQGRAFKACVSSFGFSGTNAHIVLQAADAGEPAAADSQGPWLFAVSARDAEALKRRLGDLADWLHANETADLARLAQTLGQGRAHWRYRRALLAEDRPTLLAALRQAAQDASPRPVAAGHIPHRAEGRDLARLAQAYEAGDTPDWGALFGPRRAPLALPAYPFARERFWSMPMAKAASGDGAIPAGDYAVTPQHPLLAAHRVGGQCILPGTLGLELLRGDAAALTDVAWLRPLAEKDTPVRLRVAAGTDSVELVSADGWALARGRRQAEGAVPEPPADFAAATRLAGGELYARFERAGFVYGAPLRVVEWVEIGAGAARSKLVPAAGLQHDALLLSASLLDGALQTAAAIGHGGDARLPDEQWVPHHLAALRVWRRPVGPCYAQARLEESADPDSLVFSVGLFDESGAPLAAFEGMTARRLAPAAEEGRDVAQVHLPLWRVEAALAGLPEPAAIAVAGGDARLEAGLRRSFPQARLLAISAEDGAPNLAVQLAELPAPLLVVHAGAEQTDPLPPTGEALNLARALLLAARPDGARLLSLAFCAVDAPAGLAAAGIAGLYRTLRLEAPALDARVLLAEAGVDAAAALAREAVAEYAGDPLLRYGADGLRRAADWARPAVLPPLQRLPANGVALISGGLGGIGLALGRRLAAEGASHIALLSRTPPGAAAQAAIRHMESQGAKVMALAADVADAAGLAAALAAVRESLGPIGAVYHLAGVLRDGFLLRNDEGALAEVFAAKVHGARLLDELTRQDPVEAFVLFGSTAAAFGSIGQAEYAAANACLAAFAECRAARAGKTLCLNWPLWADGGMSPPAEAVAHLQAIGMTPLPAESGFDLLARSLALDAAVATPLYGRPGLIGRLRSAAAPARSAADGALPAGTGFQYLRDLLAGITKLPHERIEPDTPFEDMGIDSIAIMKLNRQMEEDLGPVAKTLFFEYRTPNALAAHLARIKSHELGRRSPSDSGNAAPAAPHSSTASAAERAVPTESGGAADAIAIVGMAGLYPMAEDLDAFWNNLREGRDCVREIPPQRWPLEGFYDPDRDRPDTAHCKWGGFIEDADCFDARFFGIAPLEAETLDPQARKFLEVCWNALEDAGLDPDRMFDGLPERERARRACGVFVGVMYGDYQLFGPEEAQKGNLIGPNADYWNIANRVSAFLDLHGPSLAVDTACSSSLSAIHLACQSIRGGDCDMALVGGVNLCLHPRRHWILSKAGMAASDGRCRSFGAGGDGYVPGEGIGALVLKPLARARADGDRVLGVILGSALNHGGRTSGYTVPNPVAQGDAVSMALARAGVDPASLSYIEAHGTGTPLGDPIEIRGLARAFEQAMPENCAIGSVKSNIGHLESAAGIAGLTKVLLQMRERQLVPSLHAESPNPGLDLAGTGFRIVTRGEPWHSPQGAPLRAGISSFGAGGANAHVILEAGDAPADEVAADAPESRVLLLSAHDQEALRRRARQLAEFLLSAAGRRLSLRDIAHTLAAGRKPLAWRLAVLGDGREELAAALRGFADGAAGVAGVYSGMAAKRAAPASAATDPAALAEAWAQGAAPPVMPGRRVGLPGYPFAKRRLWVKIAPAANDAVRALPHPASHRFASGQPPLADHKIGGRRLLPGATSLWLALQAAGTPLRDVAWPVPGIAPADGELEVRVERDGERVAVRAADGACLLQARAASAASPASPPPNIETLAAACPETLDGPAVYAALALAGAEYGPSLRGLREVRRGDGVCLASLEPGMTPDAVLDAAFQLCFALIPDRLAGAALLPAGIGGIAVAGALESASRLAARRCDGGNGQGIAVDFHLLDDDGAAVAWIEDFRATAPGQSADSADEPPLRVLRPEWTPIAAPLDDWTPRRAWVLAERPGDAVAQSLATAWGAASGDLAQVPAGTPDAVAIVLGGTPGDLPGEALRTGYLLESLLQLLRGWAAAERPPAVLLLTREAHAGSGAGGAAAAAFLRSAARERSDWRAVALDLPAAVWEEAAQGRPLPAAVLHGLPREAGGEAVPPERLWRDGLLMQRVLAPLELPPAASPWRDGDVLLVAGSGGLGGLLARHAAARARVSVAFVGRAPQPNPATEQALQALRAQGRPACYLQADLADAAAVSSAVAQAEAQLGPIAWLAHTALVMGDAPLAELTPDTLLRVLAPKSVGLANLAAACRPARGLLLFSSSNALTANPGQAAYAAASAFVDAAAQGLPYPVHVFDWGYWGETGAVADAAHQAHLARLGVLPIRDQEGLEALERVVVAGLPRAAVLRVAERLLSPMGIDTGRAVQWRADAPKQLAESARQAATAVQQAAERFADPDLDSLNAYAARRLWQALDELGVPLAAGSALDGAALADKLGANADYRPLMAALAELLQRAGLLDGAGRSKGAAVGDVAAERARLERDAPAAAPTLALLETCMGALGDVVAGRRDAASVLFQGGDAAAVAALYQGNPVVDHFQKLAAAAVAGAVRALPERSAQNPVRILEVGAGTGGTSGFVLDALAELDGWHYRLTDLSAGLAAATAERLDPQRLRLESGRLDVTLPLGPQGVAPGSVDVLVAANVLHATPDLLEVLANLKEALAPGGLLVLNEATSRQDVNTLTFGLTPGWWAFRDAERRCPHGPLLDPARWNQALAEAGFSVAAGFGLPLARGGEHPLQSVIAAVADGFAPAPGRRARPAPAVSRAAPPSSPAAVAADLSELEQSLRRLIAETLRLEADELGVDDSFADHGADSILSVELVRRLNAAYAIDLKSTALFNYSTVRELAGYMAREHGVAAAPPTSGSDGGKRRAKRLLEVINRRREAAPVNREAEFWSRQGGDVPAETASAPVTADLDEVLSRLERGEISVAEALELNYADE
ncbi:hypothetical protein MoryE10_19020 [Methylogaea oryzae]|uniref:Polyketide synthase n=1 Tax=Methylogaea oryzae TaxID=1295382 RepID=A0A8D5AKM5_9GAMM|nr:hypothetical protein MoryE10_19020 [Methylogaea oryzae]